VFIPLLGLGPAAELVVWRIPKGTTFVLSGKVTKQRSRSLRRTRQIDAPSCHIKFGERKRRMSGLTRYAQKRPRNFIEAFALGHTARVKQKELEDGAAVGKSVFGLMKNELNVLGKMTNV
jgi:hypothetical protein